jgi:hypothetical protein
MKEANSERRLAAEHPQRPTYALGGVYKRHGRTAWSPRCQAGRSLELDRP